MSYTIPRKTLRITGAPATKFSKTYPLPKRPWGTEADEAFYSLTSTADPDKLGPALKKEVQAVIRDQLIPEYVASNLPPLLAEVRPEPVVTDPKQQAKVEELVALYDRMEVNEYDW